MDLTQELILQHGRLSPYKGKIHNATISCKTENPLCGDELSVDINIDRDQITKMAFSGAGCLISQAAASLLIDKINTVKNITKIKRFDKNTIFKLLGFKLTPSRVKCALLILQVLQKALVNY